MPFYDSIAPYYDFIFPLDKAQIDFIKAGLTKPGPDTRILDVGCGTGDLAIALSDLGFSVTAMDSDGVMIQRARQKVKNSNHPAFVQADMGSLSHVFAPTSFDLILCFGNTLVHLAGLPEMEAFLIQAAQILEKDGKLLLQILNYDHVLDHDVRKLPLIENAVIRFERWYEYDETQHLLAFTTRLTVKETGQKIDNAIPLYPLRKKELEWLLKKAGFISLSYFGNFAGTPLKEDSLPLVVEAMKTSAIRDK